jgi:hypothetical protein
MREAVSTAVSSNVSNLSSRWLLRPNLTDVVSEMVDVEEMAPSSDTIHTRAVSLDHSASGPGRGADANQSFVDASAPGSVLVPEAVLWLPRLIGYKG